MKRIHRNIITIDIGTYNIPKSKLKDFIIKKINEGSFLDFEHIEVKSKEISMKDAIKAYGKDYTLYNDEDSGLVMLGEMEGEYK